MPDNRLTSYRVGRDYFVAVVKLASGRVKVNDDEEIEGIDLRSPSEVGCFPLGQYGINTIHGIQ